MTTTYPTNGTVGPDPYPPHEQISSSRKIKTDASMRRFASHRDLNGFVVSMIRPSIICVTALNQIGLSTDGWKISNHSISKTSRPQRCFCPHTAGCGDGESTDPNQNAMTGDSILHFPPRFCSLDQNAGYLEASRISGFDITLILRRQRSVGSG